MIYFFTSLASLRPVYAPLVRKMMTNLNCRGILWVMKFPGKVDDTMNSAMKKIIPLWLIGLALFGLRFVETRTGFDAVTGLTLPTVARR